MLPLVLSVAAMGLVIFGVIGFRLLLTTGLENVEDTFRTPGVTAQEADTFGRILDSIGARFVGTAMRIYGPRRLERLEKAIRFAGRPDGLTLMVYVRRQAAFTLLALVFLLVFVGMGQPLIGVIVALTFYFWLRLWLFTAGRSRQERIDTELADFLDVLGVTVMAGLGFRQAVERVCEFHDGPLAEEMTTVLREMGVGISRRDAFIAARDRTHSDAFGSFITALLQAEELGVPLSGALNDIAADVRKDRGQAVRQAAAKAAPKVSLVVTLTIVPGALILIAGALLLGNMGDLSGLF